MGPDYGRGMAHAHGRYLCHESSHDGYFDRLYDSTDHMDNGKSIAAALHMEYRALNSAVGWAGGKIRDMAEKGLLPLYPEEKKARRPKKSVPLVQENLEKEEEPLQESSVMAPWEYVFDGVEGENGTYFWILKPAAAAAFGEMKEAGDRRIRAISKILEDDKTAEGREESLFPTLPTPR